MPSSLFSSGSVIAVASVTFILCALCPLPAYGVAAPAPAECIQNATLAVVGSGGQGILCYGPRDCLYGSDVSVRTDDPSESAFWSVINPVPSSFSTSPRVTLQVDGEAAGTLYGLTTEGLFISSDNGTTFQPVLVWNCTEAANATSPLCPAPASSSRPSGALPCSTTAPSTLSADDQVSNALFLRWTAPQAANDALYAVECDSISTFDSGQKQLSSVQIVSPSLFHGNYLTLATQGLTPSDREDYFVWFKTSQSDTGPLSGATKLIRADISAATNSTMVCNAAKAAIESAGVGKVVDVNGNAVGSPAVQVTCELFNSQDQLVVEQLVTGFVPVHMRLHRGTVTKSSSSSFVAEGAGDVNGSSPEYVTLTVTSTSMTKGASAGGLIGGTPSNGNFYITNAKRDLLHYFYIYNFGGCVDANALGMANASIHQIDVSNAPSQTLIAYRIAAAASGIDGLVATVQNGTQGLQQFTVVPSALSRIPNGGSFFFVDSLGVQWTYFFDKTGSTTRPNSTLTGTRSDNVIRIDVSNPLAASTAAEVSVVIRDAINNTPNSPFNATIPVPWPPNILVTHVAPAQPGTIGRYLITLPTDGDLSSMWETSIGGIIPLVTINGTLVRLCLESSFGADVGSTYVGSCKKDTTTDGLTIEAVYPTNPSSIAAVTDSVVAALSNPSNYPGGIVPFSVERSLFFDTLNVWQAAPGVVPVRHVVTVSVDIPKSSGNTMFSFPSQNGSFSGTICFESVAGFCPSGANVLKITRNDVYAPIRSVSAGSDPLVTVEPGHPFTNGSMVIFIEVNDGGGGAQSVLSQRGFEIVAKSGNRFKIASFPVVTTASAATSGKAFLATSNFNRFLVSATAGASATITGMIVAVGDLVYFPGDSSGATTFAQGGKMCVVATTNVPTKSFTCSGGFVANNESNQVAYRIGGSSEKNAVFSLSIGSNPTIIALVDHFLLVGDIVSFPNLRQANGNLADPTLWQNKFFRVSEVPDSRTFKVFPTITTTVTGTGEFYAIVVVRSHVSQSLKRIFDAHPRFPLNFHAHVHDVANMASVRFIYKNPGAVVPMYQHKILDSSSDTISSGSKFVLYDASNQRKFEFCVEHTIMGAGGQCNPSTNPNNAVVEFYQRIHISGITSGSNPTVSLDSVWHGIIVGEVVVFFGVNNGGAVLNGRAFSISTSDGAAFTLKPAPTTSGVAATQGWSFEVNTVYKDAASSTSTGTDDTITGPSDSIGSAVTANDTVVYFLGNQVAGTSFLTPRTCITTSVSLNGANPNTWKCLGGLGATGTNTVMGYAVVSTAARISIVRIQTGTTSPIFNTTAPHALKAGAVVIIDDCNGMTTQEKALFQHKFFRVVTIPTLSSFTLDPPLSASLTSVSATAALWFVSIRDPSVTWMATQLVRRLSTASLYPGSVVPFVPYVLSGSYAAISQKVPGTIVGRPLFTITVDTFANTNNGGILRFPLQDNSTVTVCFDKSNKCAISSNRFVRVNIANLTTATEIATKTIAEIYKAAIPGIGDVTLGSTNIVRIYLLAGTAPLQRPELWGTNSTNALCSAWTVTDFTQSFASLIGSYATADTHGGVGTWAVDAIPFPTYTFSVDGIPSLSSFVGKTTGWGLSITDNGAAATATIRVSGSKSATVPSSGVLNVGRVLTVTDKTNTFVLGSPTVKISNTVSKDVTPNPTKGNQLAGITFTAVNGELRDKRRIQIPAPTLMQTGQALTFWSINGGSPRKYAVWFDKSENSTEPVAFEVPVDVRNAPNVTAVASRIAAAVDPLPGVTASSRPQRLQVTCGQANTTVHGLSFNLFAASDNRMFTVWMDLGGSTPTFPGYTTPVRVSITNPSASANDVAQAVRAATLAHAAFASVFSISPVRLSSNIVFSQRVGGDVVGRPRVKLTVAASDITTNVAVGGNLIRLYSGLTEYTLCIRQITEDCVKPESAFMKIIDCTNAALCDSAAEVLAVIQTAVDAFGPTVFSTVSVTSLSGSVLYILTLTPGLAKPAILELTGSWVNVESMVDAGHMPRSLTTVDKFGGLNGQDGIFVPAGNASSTGWKIVESIRGSFDSASVEQDVTLASLNEALSLGNVVDTTGATLLVKDIDGSAGSRVSGNGDSGRDALRTLYTRDSRFASSMTGVLEGFGAALAGTNVTCRLWGALANTSRTPGYDRTCQIGAPVTFGLRSADTNTATPLKMYTPTAQWASGTANISWVVPETAGNTATSFENAMTEVQYMRCDAGRGSCEGAITCPGAGNTCPTASTIARSLVLSETVADALYVVRVRTKYPLSEYGQLSDALYTASPCP